MGLLTSKFSFNVNRWFPCVHFWWQMVKFGLLAFRTPQQRSWALSSGGFWSNASVVLSVGGRGVGIPFMLCLGAWRGGGQECRWEITLTEITLATRALWFHFTAHLGKLPGSVVCWQLLVTVDHVTLCLVARKKNVCNIYLAPKTRQQCWGHATPCYCTKNSLAQQSSSPSA
jgi:hypothetical protein